MASIRTAGLTKIRDGTEPAQDSRRQDPCAGVIAVARASGHHFSKPRDDIQLLAGLGVKGDAHSGHTAQHLSRVARDPSRPSLRQVHVIAAELNDELAERGFDGRTGADGRERDEAGELIRRAGLMAIVGTGGEVRARDATSARRRLRPTSRSGPSDLSASGGRAVGRAGRAWISARTSRCARAGGRFR